MKYIFLYIFCKIINLFIIKKVKSLIRFVNNIDINNKILCKNSKIIKSVLVIQKP